MRASGAGHDGLMTFVPLAVLVGFAMIVLGGPGELLDVIDEYASRAAQAILEVMSSLLA